MKQLRMCAKRTTPETPGVPRRRRSYLEGLQHRGNCRAAARHLYASCPRCRHGSPPKKGFFWVFEHVRKPWSQGPRLVPGSSQARPRVVPGSQYFREWRAPDTMRTLGDLPDAAAAAAPRPGAVPGILAPSQAFWYRPRHSCFRSLAVCRASRAPGRDPEQSGSVLDGVVEHPGHVSLCQSRGWSRCSRAVYQAFWHPFPGTLAASRASWRLPGGQPGEAARRLGRDGGVIGARRRRVGGLSGSGSCAARLAGVLGGRLRGCEGRGAGERIAWCI